MLYCATLILVLNLTYLRGELLFRSTRMDVFPGVDQETAAADFSFTNSGDRPVTILDLQTSCSDCTHAEVTKHRFAPGETGTVYAMFEVGDWQGIQERQIFVTDDVNPGKPQVLSLVTHVPMAAEVEPRTVLYDERHEENNFISVRLVAVTAKILKVTTDRPIIRTELQRIENGDRYRVLLKSPPKTSPQAATVTVTVQAGSRLIQFPVAVVIR